MRSKVAVSHELDDLEVTAAELVDEALDGLTLGKHTCGILYCFSEMEHEELLRLLKERFPYEIVGCTCIASLDGEEGFHELSVTFTVLTSDDCEFITAISDEVTAENVERCIKEVYDAARSKASGDPGLIFAIPPYNLDIMLDTFVDRLNALAPGVPVLGGVPSFNAQGDSNLTFYNDIASTSRFVILLACGNIRPVFVIQNVSGSPVELKRKVTRAEGNTVYQVGDRTFVDYLREVGVPVEQMASGNNSITFVAHPLLLENITLDGDDSYSFVRALHKIDLEEGSGTAIGAIPNGATLSICSLRSDQIEEVAVKGMAELSEKIQAGSSDYCFSTVMAVTCIGRYLLMVPKNSAEADKLKANLPDGLSLSGFYSYGEIGPRQSEEGKMVNFAHNESLVLCAF